MHTDSEVRKGEAAELLPQRLYFATVGGKRPPGNTLSTHFFSTDEELVYKSFFGDFGPLNLAAVFKYWRTLRDKLKCPGLASKRIVHWTTLNAKKRANAAFLIASFAVIELKMAPRDALKPLMATRYPFFPFQDASSSNSSYTIRLHDCLNAINKAFFFGLVDFDDFDLESYERYEEIDNGDMNWIVPDKLLAFSGPAPHTNNGTNPEIYVPYFKAHKLNTVVRLNKPAYDAKRFTDHGIRHVDLFFPDGSVPCRAILLNFLELVETSEGALAVHCKAGLGRTGCLIGAYLVKHYRMTALEAIAWLRICRPGSVIGHQQSWLEEHQSTLWKMGDAYRVRNHGAGDKIPHHPFGIYSLRKERSNADCKEKARPAEGPERARVQLGKRWELGCESALREGTTQGDLLCAAKQNQTRSRAVVAKNK